MDAKRINQGSICDILTPFTVEVPHREQKHFMWHVWTHGRGAAEQYLLEVRRVDRVHADHLFQVVALGRFQLHVQGQEIVDRTGTRGHGVPPPDALCQQELFRHGFVCDKVLLVSRWRSPIAYRFILPYKKMSPSLRREGMALPHSTYRRYNSVPTGRAGSLLHS